MRRSTTEDTTPFLRSSVVESLRVLVALLALVALASTAAAQAVSIQLDAGAFKVVGLPASSLRAPSAGWASVFAVYAGAGPGTDNIPPLVGSYSVENGALVFRPKYPLAPGPRYRVVFKGAGAPIEKMFDGPVRVAAPPARVERVYPSAAVLPSNQLRLYIYFSAPMSRGEAGQRIHILDADGKPLRDVFLPGQELWDPNNRRLTMTFDPGRIKRDLTSNTTMGPPIAEGKRYTLLIDREWRDANGAPMAEPFRKPFRGGPAVRQPPDPKTWKISTPPAASRAALVVDFGRPMNYTLLQRMLKISGARGDVAGSIDVAREESEWRFTPQNPWAAGAHRLIVDTSLEDLAGNKIGQPFDIDVFERVTERIPSSSTSLPFEVRPARHPQAPGSSRLPAEEVDHAPFTRRVHASYPRRVGARDHVRRDGRRPRRSGDAVGTRPRTGGS